MADQIRVYLFGGLEVSVASGHRVSFPSRKAAELFAYLVHSRGKAHSRARLADLLWERADEESARRNLSTTLWRIRSALKPLQGIEIRAGREDVVLACESDALLVDVEAFNRLAVTGVSPDAERLEDLKRAELLYRGDFLDGYESDWCDQERRHLAARYRDVLSAIGVMAFERGEYATCARYTEKLHGLDPLNEDVTARLMLVYHFLGRRSAALALYDQFKSLLEAELGLRPASSTTELWSRLSRQSDWTPPSTGPTSAYAQALEDGLELVGRERELGLLVSILEGRSSKPRLCVIRGGTGLGKSRLAVALSEEAALRGYEVLQGRCPELPSPPPYQIFIQALWPRIQRHLSGVGPLSAIIEKLVAVAFPRAASPVSEDAREVRPSAFVAEALLDLAVAPCSEKGTVLVLEDLHHVDPASGALLRTLLDRESNTHLVVVATLREDTPSAAILLGQLAPFAVMVPLEPLERVDADRLAMAFLGVDSLPTELREFLWSVTGGVPLFVLEFLRYLRDRGCIARIERGGITLDSNILNSARSGLPTRIKEVLRKRVDALDRPAKRVLAIAAVLGSEVSFGELEGMLGQPLDQLSEVLESLAAHRLLFDNEASVRFPHEIIRKAVLSSLRRGELRELHRAAAEMRERGGSPPEVLVWHFEAAGELDKASIYSEKVGDTARKLHANADAARWYTLALDRLPSSHDASRRAQRAKLLMKRQSVLDLIGDRQGQARDVREVLNVAESLNDTRLIAQAEHSYSRLLNRENSNQEALRRAERAIHLSRQVSDLHGEASAFESLGLAHMNLRDDRSARQAFRRALTLFRRAKDQAGEARSLVSLATIMAIDGKDSEALTHLDQAEQMLRLLGDKGSLAGAILQKGVLKRCSGQLRASESLLTAGIQIMREVGDCIGEARGLSQLAHTHVAMGRLREALHGACRAIRTAAAAKDKRALVIFLNNAAYGPFRCLGDFQRAEKAMGLVLRLVAESGREENLANYYETMAAVLLDKGDPRSALRWALRGRAYFRSLRGRFRFLGAQVDFRVGLSFFELGDYSRAFDSLRKAVSAWEKEGEQGLRAVALSLLARVCANKSRTGPALSYAREVERLIRDVDGVEKLQSVHWNQYVTFRTIGSVAAARRSLRRAFLSLQRQSVDLKGRLRRKFLYGVEGNRRIMREYDLVFGAGSAAEQLASVPVHPLSVLGVLDDAEERRRIVSEYVKAGRLTQREIALRLAVSERTVRTDVARLRKEQLPNRAPALAPLRGARIEENARE